jgi:hypothetical protein
VRRAVLLAIPFALAIPIAYGAAFAAFGSPPMLGAFAAGAFGWLVALALRAPIGLIAMRLTRSEQRAQTWVTASSGPLEEPVRLAGLLLIGRDLSTALWLGLGWASIEVLYAIGNGIALAVLAERTDPEAERVRSLLPPAAFSTSGVAWGVVERVWASALHIGFTLILAAAPLAVLLLAPIHSLINICFPAAAMRRYPMALVSLAGVVVGGGILLTGLALNAGLY